MENLESMNSFNRRNKVSTLKDKVSAGFYEDVIKPAEEALALGDDHSHQMDTLLICINKLIDAGITEKEILDLGFDGILGYCEYVDVLKLSEWYAIKDEYSGCISEYLQYGELKEIQKSMIRRGDKDAFMSTMKVPELFVCILNYAFKDKLSDAETLLKDFIKHPICVSNLAYLLMKDFKVGALSLSLSHLTEQKLKADIPVLYPGAYNLISNAFRFLNPKNLLWVQINSDGYSYKFPLYRLLLSGFTLPDNPLRMLKFVNAMEDTLYLTYSTNDIHYEYPMYTPPVLNTNILFPVEVKSKDYPDVPLKITKNWRFPFIIKDIEDGKDWSKFLSADGIKWLEEGNNASVITAYRSGDSFEDTYERWKKVTSPA